MCYLEFNFLITANKFFFDNLYIMMTDETRRFLNIERENPVKQLTQLKRATTILETRALHWGWWTICHPLNKILRQRIPIIYSILLYIFFHRNRKNYDVSPSVERPHTCNECNIPSWLMNQSYTLMEILDGVDKPEDNKKRDKMLLPILLLEKCCVLAFCRCRSSSAKPSD